MYFVTNHNTNTSKNLIYLYKLIYHILMDFIKISMNCYEPYLRPMSSMTATENIEYQKRVKVIQDVERTLHWCDTPESIDWLDEHHFDYRGLIGKGLALKAPNGMYNNQ